MVRVLIIITFIAFFSCSNIEKSTDAKNVGKSFEVTYPNVKTGNRTLDLAYRIAIGDLFTNIQDYKSKLIGEVVPVIIAGVDYNNPWIRDAAINTWNGGSFVVPEVAKNTLYSVIEENKNGKFIMTGQYWDAMLWTTGAWNHYLVTGDKVFLKKAYQITTDALEFYEVTEFSPEYNLFRGLAWSDGVAEYPEKYANVNGLSGAFFWPEHNKDKVFPKGYGIPMMSTYVNTIYYQSYNIASKMAAELKVEADKTWSSKAESLKKSINEKLWDEEIGQYALYIDEDGVYTGVQEALADAYAIMFGVADEKQTELIFKNEHISEHGITCGWPELPRFKKMNTDGMTFGRHNVTVWPQIQGMWADVAAKNRKVDIFAHELNTLAKNAVRDMQFSEIYHPISGERYGGMQMNAGEMFLWESTRRQTWAATAYMRMIYNGVFGIVLSEQGVEFSPVVPKELNNVKLTNLKYRNMILNISITGNSTEIKSFKVNGIEKEKTFIAKELTGIQNIEIVLK